MPQHRDRPEDGNDDEQLRDDGDDHGKRESWLEASRLEESLGWHWCVEGDSKQEQLHDFQACLKEEKETSMDVLD